METIEDEANAKLINCCRSSTISTGLSLPAPAAIGALQRR